jgi:hypothetical protein
MRGGMWRLSPSKLRPEAGQGDPLGQRRIADGKEGVMASAKIIRVPAKHRRELLKWHDAASPSQRAFVLLWMRALQRIFPPLPDTPDAEVIRLCERLLAVNLAIEAAYPAIDNDALRDIAMQPLDREWAALKGRLYQLPPPRSRGSVRAAAKAMLSYSGLDTYEDAAESSDMLMWLSRACFEYLASDATPAPSAVAASPDDVLLDLCRQFDTDTRELERNDALTVAQCAIDPRLSLDDDALDPLLDRWHDTLNEIIALPARTATGLRAKGGALGNALVQKVAVETGVSFEEQAEDYERLAMSLARDLTT